MTLLTRMLCRLWRRPASGSDRQDRAAEKAEAKLPDESSPDDLTAIVGIGIATQDRLYRSGIKEYGQLARATPEDVRKILGKVSRGADVEDWIAQAERLAKEGKS